jgi:hypothetical protein
MHLRGPGRGAIGIVGLNDRVSLDRTAPARDLPGIYWSHRLMLNMVRESLDKSMLEAMTCGRYPVVTPETPRSWD